MEAAGKTSLFFTLRAGHFSPSPAESVVHDTWSQSQKLDLVTSPYRRSDVLIAPRRAAADPGVMAAIRDNFHVRARWFSIGRRLRYVCFTANCPVLAITIRRAIYSIRPPPA
jgi:hypothetical protein